MQTKLIALDLDGTTFNNSGNLSFENTAAIKRAIAKNIHIIIASGRAFHTIPQSILKIKGIEYAITSNGACIHNAKNGDIIKKNPLHPQSIKKLLETERPYNLMIEAFVEGKAYSQKSFLENAVKYGASPKFTEYIRKTRIPVESIKDFIRENIDNIDNIDFTIRKDTPEKFISDVRNVEGIYVTSSVSHLIEVGDENAGKGNGLKYICEMLKIPPENTAAFGNAQNDADMLKFSGTGIAVENGDPQLKEIADKICPSNNENGIAWAFENILNI